MSRFSVFCTAALVVVAAGLPVEAPLAAGMKNAEDMLIVDCLLPGQIRSLAARHLHERPPADPDLAGRLQIRGGEYVSYDRANTTALKVG